MTIPSLGHWDLVIGHSLSFAFVPINLHVLRRPADGDDVASAVAVEIATGQVFDGYAAGIDELPRPLRAAGILRVINADTEFDRIVQVVANADDELFVGVAIQIDGPNGVAPFQLFVENLSLPKPFARRGA